VIARIVFPVTAAVLLAGCFGGSDAADEQQAVETKKMPPSALAASVRAKRTCPLNLPNGRTAPGGNTAGMNHGNGKIWTAMWPHNVVIATPDYIDPDGSVGMKWPWWRGVKGKLTITGRRLDEKAPPLTADVPGGYGRSGFQPSGISFPTEGCWEVTGAVGGAELTFVTLILKASRYSPMTEDG
jgi:hypothetical protein